MKNLKKTILLFIVALLASTPSYCIELEKMKILDDQIELKIPKGFEIMSEEWRKLKYPSERRPTIVYTDTSGGKNVTINLTKNNANQDLIEAFIEKFVKSFKQLYPSADWKGSGVVEVNEHKIGYIELVTPALNSEIYNLMFFTDIDGKLLICSFNCTLKDIEEWQPIANEIMNSIVIK